MACKLKLELIYLRCSNAWTAKKKVGHLGFPSFILVNPKHVLGLGYAICGHIYQVPVPVKTFQSHCDTPHVVPLRHQNLLFQTSNGCARLPQSQSRLYEVLLISLTLDSIDRLSRSSLTFINFYTVIFSYFPRFSKMRTNKTANLMHLFRNRTYFNSILLFLYALKCLDLVQT